MHGVADFADGAVPDRIAGSAGSANGGLNTGSTDVSRPQASIPATVTTAHSSLVPATGEQCPACGALMAADQRYCVECGQRRGDPRLPFMDAVVLMDTVIKGPRQAAPPPSPKKTRRMSANATLIAGIGTLLLALGVGVLIGRSGEHSGSNANSTPVVVKVPGTGSGSEEATSATAKANSGKGSTSGSGSKATASKAKAAAATGSSGQSKAAESVLHPANGVKMAPPEQKVGGKCSSGTAGCKGHKFTGEFFGE